MPITEGIAAAASWWGSPNAEYKLQKNWAKLFFCINCGLRKYIYLIGSGWLFEVFVRFH
ncbi:ribosomal protein S26 [Pseudomonas sp. JAI111]|uniref:hypothetical protein n=1 Tax=Pseudomonas sp. JAI111 TaxID=2735913 RepID=UPI00216719F1|nr:hypothetical protein [Pseudomonas sp. JAI111]MCS3836019.1 ribosomal protein S26 [Pseudomonas sp. JAI111]